MRFCHEIKNWDSCSMFNSFSNSNLISNSEFQTSFDKKIGDMFLFSVCMESMFMLIPWMIVHSLIVEPNICDDPKKLHK